MIQRSAIAAMTLVLFCCCMGIEAHAQSSATSDPLLQGFENPPNGARPRVWWHWMNGNISQQGIKLDLDWMHSAGLAGSRPLMRHLRRHRLCRTGWCI